MSRTRNFQNLRAVPVYQGTAKLQPYIFQRVLHKHSSSRRKLPEIFPCIQCGACCQSLEKNIFLQDLNRGDGVCKYFDEEHSLCRVYDNRPDYCNVRKMWEKYFSHKFTWQHFISINKAICATLKLNIERDKK